MVSFPLILAIILQPQGAGGDVGAAIGRLRTDDPVERRKAIDELLGMGQEAVAAALKELEGGAPDLKDRVTALVGRLSSGRWRERDEAARGLAALGPGASPLLREFLESGDPEVRWRVGAVLERIEGEREREGRLDEARRLALCEFLGEARDARAIPALLKAVASGSPAARLAAAEALGRLRDLMDPAQVEEGADKTMEALSDPASPPQGTEKARFIRVLFRLRSPSCVRPLASLLADRSEKNVHVKRLSAAALGAVGGAEALRALIDALESDEIYVRQEAAAVLGGLGAAGFGFDPAAPAGANRQAVLRYREWWCRRFGREWGP